MKLPNGVPPSNGCAEFTLKNPPPLVPSCLMAIWLATGPRAMVCSKPWIPWTPTFAPSVWTTPCVMSRIGDHDRERQQDVDRAADQVAQKFPSSLGLRPDEAADQRDQDGHADRGRDEVLEGQREHLGEVGHGRLAAVGLPVRVGGEAGGGVERDVLVHGGDARSG